MAPAVPITALIATTEVPLDMFHVEQPGKSDSQSFFLVSFSRFQMKPSKSSMPAGQYQTARDSLSYDAGGAEGETKEQSIRQLRNGL